MVNLSKNWYNADKRCKLRFVSLFYNLLFFLVERMSIMREYDKSHVEFLRLQQTPEMVYGAPIIIKRSPTEPRPGCADHHENACMKMHWVARQDDEGGAKKEDKPLTPQQAIQKMRDQMGFPNHNICSVEIHTKFETIKNGDNEVGLWRYYRRDTQYQKNRPCFIFYHGGGWVGGTPYTVENPCRLIAELSGGVVFNVDYSLAPEKKYPNGANDCWAALCHVYQHAEEYGIDPTKIAVGGDSAGGNMTAVVSLMDRDRGTHMVALQVPMYAAVTFKGSATPGYHFSIAEYEFDPSQEAELNPRVAISRPKDEEHDDEIMMGNLYFDDPEHQCLETYASPLMEKDFTGMPRCLSVSCEYDGLRIQDELYAKRLAEAGVEVKSIRYRGVSHAFIDRLGFVPQAEDLCIEIAEAMKQM